MFIRILKQIKGPISNSVTLQLRIFGLFPDLTCVDQYMNRCVISRMAPDPQNDLFENNVYIYR